MATRRYTGTCQCGRVRYEVEMDFGAAGVTFLVPGDQRTALIKPSAFRLIAGATDLEDTQFGMLVGHNQSCRHCGIRPFGKCRVKKFGGPVYAINLSTIDPLAAAHA